MLGRRGCLGCQSMHLWQITQPGDENGFRKLEFGLLLPMQQSLISGISRSSCLTVH